MAKTHEALTVDRKKWQKTNWTTSWLNVLLLTTETRQIGLLLSSFFVPSLLTHSFTHSSFTSCCHNSHNFSFHQRPLTYQLTLTVSAFWLLYSSAPLDINIRTHSLTQSLNASPENSMNWDKGFYQLLHMYDNLLLVAVKTWETVILKKIAEHWNINKIVNKCNFMNLYWAYQPLFKTMSSFKDRHKRLTIFQPSLYPDGPDIWCLDH